MSLMSWERDTEAEWWYSTNSFSELNFTTQRKNFPGKDEKKMTLNTGHVDTGVSNKGKGSKSTNLM